MLRQRLVEKWERGINLNSKYQSLLDFIEKQIEILCKTRYHKNNFGEIANYAKYIGDHIVKGQNMYLNAESAVPTQDIILFDNKLSVYACALYEVMEEMLKFYINNKLTNVSFEEIGELLESRNKMLFMSARWNTLQVMRVFDMDRERNKQKVPRRLPLLVEPCFCYDRVLETALGIDHEDGFNPNRGVTCLPPSSGKTYAANCYTNLMIMHFWLRYGESGLIRMTNNGTNAQNYGDQCAKMIEDKVWMSVFPELQKYINFLVYDKFLIII